MQEQIPGAFRSCGCKEYENDRGSILLSAKVRETNENVGKIVRVTVQNVLSSSRENKGGVGIDTGKEVHGIREWELQFMGYVSGNVSEAKTEGLWRAALHGFTRFITAYNVVVGVMMAIRWLEAHVKEIIRHKAPTREQLQNLDCLKDLDLF